MMSASKSTATPTTQAAAPASSAEGDWIEVKSKRTKPKKDAASPAANGKANAKQPGAGKQENASSGGNAQRQRKEGGGKANQSKEAPASPKGNASGDDQSGSKPQKRKNFVQPADDALKEKWIKEVQELKTKLVLKDDFDWKLVLPEVEAAAPTGDKSNPASWANRLFKGQQPAASAAQAAETSKAAVNPLSLIGGFDLSYLKGDNKRPVAVAALVVCTFPALEVVYESIREVKVDEPYLSGFLSFREVPHFLALLNQLKETKPELMPQLLIVDGNGLLHQKGFGLACHLGVLANLPTIGVAKKLFTIDGINEQSVRNLTAEQPLDVGEAIELRGRSGTVHGAMMQTKAAGRAIFLSIGHRISLKTAVDVVRECCPKTKLPVPVEIADVKSRDEVANVEQRIALAIQRRKEKKLQYEAQREQRLAENNQRRKERENQRKERGSPKENGQRGSPKGGFDRKGGKGQAKGQAQGGKGAQGGRAAIPRAQQGQQPAAATAAAKTQQAAPAPAQATAPAATQPAATPSTTTTTTTGTAPAAAQALATAQPQSPTQARVKVVNKTPQGNKAQQQAKGQGQQGKQVHQPKKQN